MRKCLFSTSSCLELDIEPPGLFQRSHSHESLLLSRATSEVRFALFDSNSWLESHCTVLPLRSHQSSHSP